MYRRIWSLAWPTVLYSLLELSLGLADLLMVRGFGQDATAAIGLTRQIGFLLEAAALAIATGVITLVSQGVGSGNRRQVDGVIHQSTRLVFLLGVPLTLVGYYLERYPKACLQGWGRVSMTVAPDGFVLPCQTAREIPGLEFPSVKDHSLEEIWFTAPVFQRFRGTEWMPELCRSCDRREIDFGGCRCQAFLMTGDPAATDPVCHLSPHHHLVDEALQEAQQGDPPLQFRVMSRGRRCSCASSPWNTLRCTETLRNQCRAWPVHVAPRDNSGSL